MQPPTLRDTLAAALASGLALATSGCSEATQPAVSVSAGGASSSPAATATATAAAPPPRASALAVPPGCKPERYCRAPRTPPDDGGGMAPGHTPPPQTYDANGCLSAEKVGHTCNGIRAYDGPTFDGSQCCYTICRFPVPCGRVLWADGEQGAEPRVADAAAHPGWAALAGPARAPSRALHDAWLADALLEHAAVASFTRLALELLACGAPAELVRGAHEAAADEVAHARLCFALAASYAPGREAPLGPANLSLRGVSLGHGLAELAARTVREACVGETLATLVAARAQEACLDPEVRRVLARVEQDERRHAALAFRVVGWALAAGGAPVQAAVAEALTLGLADLDRVEVADVAEGAGQGRLPARAAAAVVADARALVLELLAPAMRPLEAAAG